MLTKAESSAPVSTLRMTTTWAGWTPVGASDAPERKSEGVAPLGPGGAWSLEGATEDGYNSLPWQGASSSSFS